ncbi:beta-lactamase family protein [Marixanthomonas sp. SCSIO 43207]|uniref:serine hydrolase domain-containing protein n=1 Tax=Marixanthomonas sp. SCSIO 43207 TaxID=2779360 RepID=UPI001CA87EB7|nr:serine hydrolase domain-containing protein [Marixanthomonas sp. SCSIO 43207]UAB80048.1 beta-lactamase family protein [Marixanthomonas sp. SCSIO 43207]
MKTVFIGFLLLVGVSAAGQQTIPSSIEQLVTAQFEKEHIQSGIVHVYSKSRGLNIQWANSKEDTITTHSPFYTASITKLLTATAIGILQDQKKLHFDDSVAQYLPPSLLNKLHVLDGNEYSNDITLAHLLQHTSGLPDYFTDTTTDNSPNVINQLLLKPNKVWSPEELIQFTKDKMTPHFKPGLGHYYTDTGYVLLALVVETVSDMPFHQFLHRHVFQPLGMTHSYINLKSTPIDKSLPMAAFYAGTHKLSAIPSLSADWGGGGLVSTTQDLITFFKAYHADDLLQKETRLMMQNWVDETVGMHYGFGIRKVSFSNLLDTETSLHVLGHSGSTASFLWYCPELDTYVSGTLNQLEASKNALLLVYDILHVIENN